MVVKVYVDYSSQPSRALVIFLRNTKIPFEIEEVNLMGEDHQKPEFVKITPLCTVPAIQDGDFSMGETVAIIRYLATKYADLVPDHWYPKDLEKRARVDEYMAFHHTGTRGGCCGIFFSEMMENTLHGRDVTVGRPKLKAFVDRVKDRLNPIFDEIHAEMYAWKDKYCSEIL
nr:glutathione S-transferase theta-1-like [Lytechinus pictus]